MIAFMLIGSFSQQSTIKAGDFELKEEIDSVEILYKWRHSCFLSKKSPYRLVLRVKNHSQQRVTLHFTVDYYWRGIIHSSSQPQSVCIPAEGKSNGRVRGLAFKNGGFSNSQIEGDRFLWEISGLKVEPTPDCERDFYLFKRNLNQFEPYEEK